MMLNVPSLSRERVLKMTDYNYHEADGPRLERRMADLLGQLNNLISVGKKYVAAEKAAEGEIHISEGKGFAGAEGTMANKEHAAKIARGEAEKRESMNVAMGWAARTKVKALLAEIDVCRSIYSARKAELSNTR
jgi:hypothetical protein